MRGLCDFGVFGCFLVFSLFPIAFAGFMWFCDFVGFFVVLGMLDWLCCCCFMWVGVIQTLLVFVGTFGFLLFLVFSSVL